MVANLQTRAWLANLVPRGILLILSYCGQEGSARGGGWFFPSRVAIGTWNDKNVSPHPNRKTISILFFVSPSREDGGSRGANGNQKWVNISAPTNTVKQHVEVNERDLLIFQCFTNMCNVVHCIPASPACVSYVSS